jgi:hypothetical protein
MSVPWKRRRHGLHGPRVTSSGGSRHRREVACAREAVAAYFAALDREALVSRLDRALHDLLGEPDHEEAHADLADELVDALGLFTPRHGGT